MVLDLDILYFILFYFILFYHKNILNPNHFSLPQGKKKKKKAVEIPCHGVFVEI
jgi:hypothetical protein